MVHIPYSILRDSCVLRMYREDGIFGERRLINETRLGRVRIEIDRKKGADTHGGNAYGRGRLYYDCGRSLPAEAELFDDGCVSIVEFRDREYRVTGAKYVYCGGGLHHIELELGGTA